MCGSLYFSSSHRENECLSRIIPCRYIYSSVSSRDGMNSTHRRYVHRRRPSLGQRRRHQFRLQRDEVDDPARPGRRGVGRLGPRVRRLGRLLVRVGPDGGPPPRPAAVAVAVLAVAVQGQHGLQLPAQHEALPVAARLGVHVGLRVLRLKRPLVFAGAALFHRRKDS